MKGFPLLFAASASAMALLLAAPAEVAAQDTSVTGEQLQQAGKVPLIGKYLQNAARTRRDGICERRTADLQAATEMVEFARRYIRQNPNTDKFSEDDLSAAQRALDREKAKVCTSNELELRAQAKAADLPVLTGTVVDLPSKLGPDATVRERFSEFSIPLVDILKSDATYDNGLVRRLMQNLQDLLSEMRARRDGALAAGELSTVDAWQANADYIEALENVRWHEQLYRYYRLRTERAQLQEQQSKEQSYLGPCEDESAEKCAALLSGDPLPLSETEPLTDDEEAMLAVHNRARHDFGVPPLMWDSALANSAREYALVLVETGRLVHAPREGREHERENLLATNIGYRSPAEMIEVMVAEKQYFKPGIYPDISTTGDWYPVGHYTQIVWPWTTHVGCAIESSELFDYTVCRYTPPGNRNGNPLYPGGYMPPPPPPPPP